MTLRQHGTQLDDVLDVTPRQLADDLLQRRRIGRRNEELCAGIERLRRGVRTERQEQHRRCRGDAPQRASRVPHGGAPFPYVNVYIDSTQSFTLGVRVVKRLSLIHISEPTRRTPISYAVFC